MAQTHLKQRWAGGAERGQAAYASGALQGEQTRGWVISWLCLLLSASKGPVQAPTIPRYRQSTQDLIKDAATWGGGAGSAQESIFERLVIPMKNCRRQGLLRTRTLAPPLCLPNSVASILAIIMVFGDYLPLSSSWAVLCSSLHREFLASGSQDPADICGSE